MADTVGKAEMVDTHTKSLVSEQYLDGWSYDDDEDDSESETSPIAQQKSVEKKASPGGMKRTFTEEGPAERKKMCFNLKDKNTSPDSTTTSGPAKKISMSFGPSAAKSSKTAPVPIKMKVAAPGQTQQESKVKAKKSSAVAKAFGNDSSESEEEMPPEARMRMRNIGRDTPTAAGPNSFGKGRLGFCDRQKIIERQLQKEANDEK